jgi:hypothetical protein
MLGGSLTLRHFMPRAITYKLTFTVPETPSLPCADMLNGRFETTGRRGEHNFHFYVAQLLSTRTLTGVSL